MKSHRSAASNGSARWIWAALVLVFALGAWLAWRWTSDGIGSPRLAGPATAAIAEPAPSDSTGELALGDRIATGTQTALSLRADFPIPVGVRVPGAGSLSGRVRDRHSGAGVAGARVDLLALPPGGAQIFGKVLRLADISPDMSERIQPIATAASGPDGGFHFEGVRPGEYFLEARAPHAVPEAPQSASVTRRGGDAPVELWTRAGGRVLGRVVLPDGRAAGGAKVALTPGIETFLDSARTGDLCWLETTCDAVGTFVLAGVPPSDNASLHASGTGFALTHVQGIAVRAGEDSLVEVQARTGGSIVGRVFSVGDESDPDAQRLPLAGAHLGAVPRGLRDLAFVEEVLLATHGVSDGDGNFLLSHCPSGEVDVLAIAPGHLPVKGASVWIEDDGRAATPDVELPRGAQVNVRVVDSAQAPVEAAQVRWNMVQMDNFENDFSLAPLLVQAVEGFDFPLTDADGRCTAGPFAGEPEHEVEVWKLGYQREEAQWDPTEGSELVVQLSRGGILEGIVMDAQAHEPVKRFSVSGKARIDREPQAPSSLNPYSGGELFEDENGRFRLQGVEAGTITLHFCAPGFLRESVSEIEVKEGETTRGLIVELARGATITGVVLDTDARPVPGAQVMWSARDEGPELPRPGRRARRAEQHDDELVIESDNLPPGMAAYALALGIFGDRAVLSDSQGAFVLRGVEPGAVRLFAAHRDFVPAVLDLEDVAVETLHQVTLELNSGGGVFGHAVDRFDRPVPRAIVLALSPGNLGDSEAAGAVYQGNTDEQGRYEIRHMAAGSYFLVLTRGDEALNPLSFLGNMHFDLVTVPADRMVEFDLRDESSGGTRVSGKVTWRGTAASSGRVTAVGFESESLLGVDFKLAPIQNGLFEFKGLAPGEYQFRVEDAEVEGERMSSSMQLEVPDQPEVTLDLILPEGGVAGRVLDAATRQPIEEAWLTLKNSDAPVPTGVFARMITQEGGESERTDAAGEFRFERLQGGTYEIAVRPPRDREGARYAPADPIEVRVSDGRVQDGVEFLLEPALALTGQIRSSAGVPIEKASILARRAEGGSRPERAASEADGRYELAYLAPGTYELSVTAEDFAVSTVTGIVLERGTPKTQDVVLQEGVLVRARVRGADGKPLSGVTGRLTSKDPARTSDLGDAGQVFSNLFSGKGVSDDTGLLELGRFAPGEYELEARRGFKVSREDVSVTGPGAVEVTLVLR